MPEPSFADSSLKSRLVGWMIRTSGISWWLEHGRQDEIMFQPDAYSPQIRYVHRTLPSKEIYWVNKPDSASVTIDAMFRVTGKRPQVWHPENGIVEEVSYIIEDGYTRVSLPLLLDDAVFVVFEEDTRQTVAQVAKFHDMPMAYIRAPWSVEFQSERGAPDVAQFDSLVSYIPTIPMQISDTFQAQ